MPKTRTRRSYRPTKASTYYYRGFEIVKSESQHDAERWFANRVGADQPVGGYFATLGAVERAIDDFRGAIALKKAEHFANSYGMGGNALAGLQHAHARRDDVVVIGHGLAGAEFAAIEAHLIAGIHRRETSADLICLETPLCVPGRQYISDTEVDELMRTVLTVIADTPARKSYIL